VTVRVLLDTHTLLWWLDGDRRLSRRARQTVADEANAVLVSAASAWEIATKVRIGKLPGAVDVAADVVGCLARQRFESLDITVLHAQRAGRLPGTHRDPFDRMLIAQAQIEDLPIVTNDEVFDGYGVTRLW
jgi:PIN domain nuclease of toxin-antitoxin system